MSTEMVVWKMHSISDSFFQLVVLDVCRNLGMSPPLVGIRNRLNSQSGISAIFRMTLNTAFVTFVRNVKSSVS